MEDIQLVLSGFKGATDISVLSGEEPEYLYVYLGLALLERVPTDPAQFLRQLMVARLVNAGVSVRLLAGHFHHSPKTMRAWADAVLIGDLDRILRAFSGRGPQPRMTPQIRAFTKGQYVALRVVFADYRKRVRFAVRERFGEDFSDAYLSRLFAKFADEESPSSLPEDLSSVDSQECQEESNRAQGEEGSGSDSDEAVTYSSALSDSAPSPEVPLGPRMPVSNVRVTDEPVLVHHAGQIIFCPWIDLVGHDRPQESRMHNQWLGQILQGAVNIEQSKKLAAGDLAMFVGPVRPNHNAQRAELAAQVGVDTLLSVFSRNGRLPTGGDPSLQTVFYYDPHGKEYTGAAKILKGWCGSRHAVGKMLYMDMVHTRCGTPCFVYHADNYDDLRERFFLMLHLFRRCFPAAHARTWVIDRGIFGLSTFVRLRDCGDHILTWEKGYAGRGWDDKLAFITFRRCRERNRRADLLVWQFECQEHSWPKGEWIRRIIVRAANPNGATVELAILCSNPTMPAEEAVTLMFNRWIQENDLGYLDRHFGLCEITSYDTEAYANIEHTLHDRDVACPEFTQLKKERRAIEANLQNELLKREKKADLLQALAAQITKLQATEEALIKKTKERHAQVDHTSPSYQAFLKRTRKAMDQAKQIQRQLKTLRRRTQTHENTLESIQAKISIIKEDERKLAEKIAAALRDESRLKLLVMENYRRLNTGKKAVMDALRITGRNIFYAALQLFRPIYNNYRDDHDILRQLSRSPGAIRFNRDLNTIEIRLWMEGTLQKAPLERIRQFLQLVTTGINQHFKGRATPVDIDILHGHHGSLGAHFPSHTS